MIIESEEHTMYDTIYCPRCGNPMKRKNWHEDGYLVEWNESCKCGYNRGWSYGAYSEESPDNEEEDDEGATYYALYSNLSANAKVAYVKVKKGSSIELEAENMGWYGEEVDWEEIYKSEYLENTEDK